MMTRRMMLMSGAPLLAADWWPQEDPKLLFEMVTVAHGNVARVKELVGSNVALARATVDWGFGDWETALGAAAHVGNRAIAEFLIERGAEPTIFAAAMLGQLEVVRAMVTAQPALERQLGPHGITLLAHARAGGEAAKQVYEFLRERGEAGKGWKVEAPGEERIAAVSGQYVFEGGERFVVEVVKG
jgi:hypothetical protein